MSDSTFPIHRRPPLDRAAYLRDGWALYRSFASSIELDTLRYEIDVLIQGGGNGRVIRYTEDAGGAQRVVRLERVWENLPSLAGGRLGGDIVAYARELFGSTQLFKDKINLRYPRADGYAPHQDTAAGWLQYGSRFVTLCLLLAPSSLSNGGFEVVSGVHQRGRFANENGRMAHELFEELGPEPVSAMAGDLLLLDGEIPHRTSINLSAEVVTHLLLTFVTDERPDARAAYYEDKLADFPRLPTGDVQFRVFAV